MKKKHSKKLFFIIPTLFLAIMIVNALPTTGDSQTENINVTCIFHETLNINTRIKLVSNNQTFLLTKENCQKITGIEKIIVETDETTTEITRPGNYTIEYARDSITIYNHYNKPIIEKIICNTLGENTSYYLKITSPAITREANTTFDIIVLKNDTIIHIPVKTILYSLENNTIFIPPAKCNSPPNQMLGTNDCIIIKIEDPQGSLLVIYSGGTEENVGHTTLITDNNQLTKTITNLPAYQPVPEEPGKQGMSGEEKIYLFTIVLGVLLLASSTHTRKRG